MLSDSNFPFFITTVIIELRFPLSSAFAFLFALLTTEWRVLSDSNFQAKGGFVFVLGRQPVICQAVIYLGCVLVQCI